MGKSFPWGFTQYNIVVKQVEVVSDALHDVAEHIGPVSGGDRVAVHLLKHLRRAVAQLDKHALQMLAAYDPAAAGMLQAGVVCDTRRRVRRPQNSAGETKGLKLLRSRSDGI